MLYRRFKYTLFDDYFFKKLNDEINIIYYNEIRHVCRFNKIFRKQFLKHIEKFLYKFRRNKYNI